MSHSLSQKQTEYINFIKQFIDKNESSPRLIDIAEHFRVKKSTAHNVLRALQIKGFLRFGRSKNIGFFIHLIDHSNAVAEMTLLNIVGKFDNYGFVYRIPKPVGLFPITLIGSKPEDVFGLLAADNIDSADISYKDLLIFDFEKKAKPHDICILSVGGYMMLVLIVGKTFSSDVKSIKMATVYPMPEGIGEDRGQKLFWLPLAWNRKTEDFFLKYFVGENINLPDYITKKAFATCIRLEREPPFQTFL